jgi:hypothetical protein
METDAIADGSQSGRKSTQRGALKCQTCFDGAIEGVCRNISMARFDLKKGEQTAHACGKAC